MSSTAVTQDQSNLASAVAPQGDGSASNPIVLPAPDSSNQTGAQSTPPAPTSRLGAILGAVARTVSTGLSGIPSTGRPGFVSGLGQGARAAQAANAAAQEIKFKDFDTQVRLANLHNQDQELQLRTQAQQDAHQAAQNTQADYDEEHGISFDPHPNDGAAVMDTLKGQTQANGVAEVPAGTHLSADGKTVNVPDPSQETAQGLLAKYKQLQGPLSLPALPQNAQFVPGRNLDVMTHKLGGYKADGTPWNHDDLPQQIISMQSQRDALAKNGATPYQLQTINNTIGIMQAQSDALDKHAAGVEQQKAQSKKAGEIAADMSPQGRALAASNEKLKEQGQDNSAGNKTQKTDAQMYVGSDASGNQIAGTGDDLKTAGASGVTKLGADDQKKVLTARQLTSPAGLFAQIKQDMLNLDAKGKMGSSATARFNDALLSKAGSDPDYAPLFVHTHLLATALMQAHVGSRGSSDMMEEFKSLANAGKMNAATLRSALGAEYSYVHEKAMLPKKQVNGGGQ